MTLPDFAFWFAETTLWTSLLVLFVIAVRGVVAKRFGTRVAVLLWAIPALRLVMPPMAEVTTIDTIAAPEPAAASTIETTAHTWAEVAPAALAAPIAEPMETAVQEAAVASAPSWWATATHTIAQLDWLLIALCVACGLWLAGALAYFLRVGLETNAWRRTMETECLKTPLAVRARARRVAQQAGLRNVPELIFSRAAATPQVVGFARPVVVLPCDFCDQFTEAQQDLALLHEFTHIRRADLVTSWLAAALVALQWFNPLMHRAYALFREDQEAACDEAVLARGAARSAYADTLMVSVRSQFAPAPALTLTQGLKTRLKRMANAPASDRLIRMGSASLVALAVATTAATAGSYTVVQEVEAPQDEASEDKEAPKDEQPAADSGPMDLQAPTPDAASAPKASPAPSAQPEEDAATEAKVKTIVETIFMGDTDDARITIEGEKVIEFKADDGTMRHVLIMGRDDDEETLIEALRSAEHGNFAVPHSSKSISKLFIVGDDGDQSVAEVLADSDNEVVARMLEQAQHAASIARLESGELEIRADALRDAEERARTMQRFTAKTKRNGDTLRSHGRTFRVSTGDFTFVVVGDPFEGIEPPQPPHNPTPGSFGLRAPTPPTPPKAPPAPKKVEGGTWMFVPDPPDMSAFESEMRDFEVRLEREMDEFEETMEVFGEEMEEFGERMGEVGEIVGELAEECRERLDDDDERMVVLRERNPEGGMIKAICAPRISGDNDEKALIAFIESSRRLSAKEKKEAIDKLD